MRLKPLAVACLAALLALFLPPLPHAPEEDVILIGSFDQLCAFSHRVALGQLTDAHVRLTADIMATRPLRPIGTALHMFSGEFDGQGHVISRLIAASPSGSQGLFGCVGPEGVVKNVTLESACVMGAGYVGGVAGYSAGRVEGCRVERSRVICLSRDQYGAAAGGVVGLGSGRVEGCAALLCSVRGPANTGGVCGAFYAGVMARCAFTGAVACAGDVEAHAGLIAGSLHSGARMRFCAGRGAVFAFQNGIAGGAAGGVYSGSSTAGCVAGGPENRGAARLTAALSTALSEEARNNNFQHFLP